MIPVLSVENMRRVEAAADASGLSYSDMMENAGRVAAQRAFDLLDGLQDPRVTVLVGSGNNGGDGLVAGRYLAQREDVQVRFYLLTRRDDNDPNFKAIQDAGLFITYAEDDRDQRLVRNMVASADLVIDALFGIGIRLPIKDDAAKVLRNVNQALNERRTALPEEMTIYPTQPDKMSRIPQPKVLAIDCPSGLDCDTGQLDKSAIHADETITFIAAKPGLVTFPGAQAVGKLSVATIGIPADLREMKDAQANMATANAVRRLLPPRPGDSNKGTHGKAMIIAGSINYSGAPGLAAIASYRAGAGLVTVGAPAPVISALASHILETTWVMLPHDMGVLSEAAAPLILEQTKDYRALLLGPGWGQEDTTGELLKRLLEKSGAKAKPRSKRGIGFRIQVEQQPDEEKAISLPPLVIDADALNLLAKIEDWWTLLPENTIITPHPGEMSRLSGLEISEIQSNRWDTAAQKAKDWNVILVLKGAHTLIAAPDGRICVLPFKTDALATAGTGDVLAGLIAGMLAQGMSPFDAAVVAGYIHGLSGELAAQKYHSGRGVIAGDLLGTIPTALGIIENA